MAAVVAVLMVLVATVATVSADESLGELEFSIGQPGQQAYGLEVGVYGVLNSGEFPGPLFVDGQPREVQSIIEADTDAWELAYSGSPDLWASDLVLGKMLTPWVPVIFGYGSTIAASINFVNIAVGAFAYKVFVARAEA